MIVAGTRAVKKQWHYFVAVFLLPIIGIAWWWGVFSEAKVETGQVRGPYHYAYLTQNGALDKLPEAQQFARRELEQQGIVGGAPITVLLTDPRTTARKELTARVGYLVDVAAKVAEPLKLADIPAREVIVTRVRAHPTVAPGKAYAALIEHLDGQGGSLKLPTVEVYRDGELSLEMDR
jgi:effector-binding domain-containing protein